MKEFNGKPVEILLIEDNPGDVLLTREAFKKSKIANRIEVARDGEEALSYLNREGEHADAIRPDLILLDLNLPGLDGREVLQQIKTDSELRRIPVVVLTSSSADRDLISSYDKHANGYIVKPVDIMQFASVVAAIEGFWFTVVALPD